MKSLMLAAAMLLMGTACFAQTRTLPKPNLKRQTLSVMSAFKQRKSVRTYSAKSLSEQDLSDLLWAAQGKNREDGHMCSPLKTFRSTILKRTPSRKWPMVTTAILWQQVRTLLKPLLSASFWWLTLTSLAATTSMLSGWWVLMWALLARTSTSSALLQVCAPFLVAR